MVKFKIPLKCATVNMLYAVYTCQLMPFSDLNRTNFMLISYTNSRIIGGADPEIDAKYK